MKEFLSPAAVLAFLLFVGGCAELAEMGRTLGEEAGILSAQEEEEREQLVGQSTSVVRPMTDQEEYFLGRAVAATILSRYRLYDDPRWTQYLNEVGQTVALASDRPLTYGGYHFAILDSEEINALSCPGGMIFITRGLLRQVKTEDELAAILAHEVAHVNHRDGVAAVQRSRWVQVVTLLGTQAAQQYGGAELNELVSLFQGSAQDVVKTLLVNGYSRQEESEADESALTFLHRLGYNPYALPDTLEIMAQRQEQGNTGGIFATHPGIRYRAGADMAVISQNKWAKESNPARDQRFRQVFASLQGKK